VFVRPSSPGRWLGDGISGIERQWLPATCYDIASEEDKRTALERARAYREARAQKSNVTAINRQA
jgi:hypothetical protein